MRTALTPQRDLWAIKPEMLKTITQTLGAGLSGEELRQRALAPDDGEPPDTGGAVAVLRLRGVITPFGSFLSLLFGGGPGGLVGFQASLQEAVADPEISAIVLEVDSPGGIIDLVPETAAMIREARAQKPIVAVANTMAASAAYWLASQADELVVTPSGEVGSIGVFVMHEDISGALEADGIDITFVQAGQYKTEANPFEPLSAEAEAYLQERVDEVYSMFVADVALGRDASEDDVRSEFGEGRVVSAERAVELGMADSVATLEETIARVAAEAAGGSDSASRSHSRPIGRVASRQRARASLEGLRAYAAEEHEKPPADVPVVGLLRGVRAGAGLAAQADDQAERRPHLVGHFATFDDWYEVNSVLEGHFLERITLGAFAKTFQEQRDRLRAIFDHGLDPQIGLKPLGPIEKLFEEAGAGAAYDVALIDTFYNRELIPGIEAGLYGASFRFRVIKEEFDPRPGRSAHNPQGLPERTIKELLVREFGPAPFPVSSGPTASLRSLTDHFAGKYAARHRDADEASAQALIGALAIPSLSPQSTVTARPTQQAETRSHFGNGRRDSNHLYGLDAQKEKPSWHL